MTAATSPVPATTRRSVTGAATGAVLLITAGVAAWTLATRASAKGAASGRTVTDTLYPMSAWVLVTLLALGGVVAVWGRWSESVTAVTGVAMGGVAAAQLAGMGLVANKHWGPWTGMGMSADNLDQLHRMALAMAVSAAVAVVVCLGSLVQLHGFDAPSPVVARRTSLAVGAAVVVLVPLVVGAGSPETLDLTSLGAFALMWALPWGIALILCGWLVRPGVLGAVVGVGVSALAALVTAPMTEIVFSQTYRAAFALVLVAVGVVARERLRPQPVASRTSDRPYQVD